MLRLAHPRFEGDLQTIAHYVTKGWENVGDKPHDQEALLPIWAFERAKRATSSKEIIRLIRDYRLVRECIPTQFLNDKDVWEALLEDMPLTALIRNLGKMSSIGLIAPLSKAANYAVQRLTDPQQLHKARIHPLNLLVALNTYNQGHGEKGKLSWTRVQQVTDALDSAFYLAFKAIEPTNKRWLLALDVSGSMSGPEISGMAGITPRIGSAAMALITAASESQHHIFGFSHHLVEVPISPRMRLDAAVNAVSRIPMGGTNCSLPMVYALQNKIEADAFVVYTDSETWAGSIHPVQALKEYRQKMGIPAKLIVVGMVANQFTIADPDDAGMLDIVGFDTSAPAVMADFVRN